MYVAPDFRRQGHARRLMSTVQEAMQADGGLELRLYVHADNATAIRAYTKMGFVPSDYKIMVWKQKVPEKETKKTTTTTKTTT